MTNLHSLYSRWRWLPPGLMAVAIFIVSSIPGHSLPHSPVVGFDKLVHATEYAILGVLVAYALTYALTHALTHALTDTLTHALTDRALTSRLSSGEGRFGPASPIRRMILAWLAVSLFGVSDEIHQHFVAGRFADPFDALADSVGALLGVTIVFIVVFVMGKKNA